MNDYIALMKPRLMPLLNLASVSAAITASKSINLQVIVPLLIAGCLGCGGASALNCYLEKSIDEKMPRTKSRPVPSERIPGNTALFFGLSLLIASLAISYIFINLSVAFYILLGAFFYVVIYTKWLKQKSSLNIVIGGFAGSCASLAGWASVQPPGIFAWLIALFVFLWTPSHFWPLAIKIKDDYSKAGIPMLPSIVSHKKACYFIIINTLLLIASSVLVYLYGGLSIIFLAPAMLFGAIFVFFNIQLFNDEKKAFKNFMFSILYLSVLLITMAADSLL
ncbi:MAG: protoheme IX farnesyltransferase [Candidatus Aenigmarchaeota archaeon]|nr:protoheme IX farnesyltransferase [Candidatus Aenigmarchaeota archaeon]